MSGALALLTPVISPLASAAGFQPGMLISPQRRIGVIVPDVVVEESGTDQLTITQHPIADGSPVSDHAYMMPARLTMRCGWSNTPTLGGLISGDLTGTIASVLEGRVREIYAQLLALQKAAEPFDVTTGKRTYNDMLIDQLSVKTDHTLEYTLLIEISMQQVFRVKTATTQQPAMSDQMDGGEKTADTTDSPAKQATPSPRDEHSLLQSMGVGGDYQKPP